MTYFLAQANKAEKAIARIRELHAQDGDYCAVCYNKGGSYASASRAVWPCVTIETLEGEQ